MQITHKTTAALTVALLASLAAAALILDRAVRPGFEQLEAAEHARDIGRVEADLDALAAAMRNRVSDYALWDETYAFVAGRHPAYIEQFADSWLEDYGIDFVVFADTGGRLLWRRAASGLETLDSEALLRQAAGAATADGPAAGVVWLPEIGFALVAASPSLRSDGSGVPRGMVIMGQRLSAGALSTQARLDIELMGPAATPAEAAAPLAALRRTAAPQSWRSPNQIYTLLPLRDLRGQISGAVKTTLQRDALALGQRSIALALGLIALALAVATVLLWALLQSMVIRRLKRLETHLRAQHGEPVEAPVRPGRSDEIDRLTEAYNAMAARVRESGQRERAAIVQREGEAAANRMKSVFLANISHELRRPLDAIIGYAELIGEENSGPEAARTRADLERITGSARQLLTLIGEILDLSRIDAGRLELKPETFDVAALVASVETIAAPIAKARSLQLELQIGALGSAYTDRRRLHQFVGNAVSAACRLSCEASTVTLLAHRTGDTLCFDVRAPGVELTRAQLAQTLEPFTGMFEPVSRRAADGGLSLAVASKLAALLGGELAATAMDGGGAVFTLTAAAALDDGAVPLGAAA